VIFLGWAEAAIKREKMIKQSLKIADSERNRRYYQKNRNKVKRRVKENYIKLRLHIIEILGGECVFCEETNTSLLNLHHRVPMEVKENKIYHYKKNEDILMLLCIRCHVTYHNVMDWLKIDDIYKE
jgi:hypothetical protein